jgi:Cd2+/Zn2+-exporting ATPase/Cu+-exporting ATPase
MAEVTIDTRAEFPIAGMDCAECTGRVRQALLGVPGVSSAEVFLGSQKAVVEFSAPVSVEAIRRAVADAGYSVPEATQQRPAAENERLARMTGRLLVGVSLAVLLIVVVGEWLGALEWLNERVPLPIGALLVAAAGLPIFVNVVRALARRQVIAHTLMTVGVLAALAVGAWTTALIVVFFMRVGDAVESFTTARAGQSVRELASLAPRTARVMRQGQEVEIAAAEVAMGEIVVVRPGELIPVDGVVVDGKATVDQAAITGEPMPADVGPGSHVFAATIARLGSVRVRAEQVGARTTFGRVVTLVEEAEANRAEVQRFADRFTVYFLPLVAGVALLTFLISRDPLATAAVLVVACSCAVALATPVAMLGSIGAAARHGLLFKGGRVIEAMAQADVLLIDKTGTITFGRPRLVAVAANGGLDERELLSLAASAERYSEHPLAEAVRQAAVERGLGLSDPVGFEAAPGRGVRASVNGRTVMVGNRAWVGGGPAPEAASALEGEGRIVLHVAVDGRPAGALALSDSLRPEVQAALTQARKLGISQIELLTGDEAATARPLAERLGIAFRAGLLPEEKIAVVRAHQAAGRRVVMVGDGVNDAPALAQADVGMAMGAAGTDLAIEAAHVVLLRDDWALVSEAMRLARRTMRVVKGNLLFAGAYNLIGLSLAAAGLLPPIWAAAAQSLPDLIILGNSSRLLRHRLEEV